MIKFLKKIRFELINKNMNTKYFKYAIGEIVLVVIGILIALQINNWNEERKKTNFEQNILKELKSDFSYNKSELNKNIIKATTLAQNSDSLLVLLNLPKEEVAQGKFYNYMRKLGGYSTFNPSNGALNSLISSGNLYIIKNDSLRLHLARWSGILEDVKEDEERLIDFGDTNMEPIALEYLQPRSKSANIDPVLFQNLKFENIVRTIKGSANYNVENYNIIGIEITKILEQINQEVYYE